MARFLHIYTYQYIWFRVICKFVCAMCIWRMFKHLHLHRIIITLQPTTTTKNVWKNVPFILFINWNKVFAGKCFERSKKRSPQPQRKDVMYAYYVYVIRLWEWYTHYIYAIELFWYFKCSSFHSQSSYSYYSFLHLIKHVFFLSHTRIHTPITHTLTKQDSKLHTLHL